MINDFILVYDNSFSKDECEDYIKFNGTLYFKWGRVQRRIMSIS